MDPRTLDGYAAAEPLPAPGVGLTHRDEIVPSDAAMPLTPRIDFASAMKARPLSLRVRRSDGYLLHVTEWAADGPLLVLLHGFGLQSRIWDDFVSRACNGWRVLAPDLRGHGDSDGSPTGEYHTRILANDAERLLDMLGSESCVLVGHSLGGRVAIHVAASRPERVHKLVLVEAGPKLERAAVEEVAQQVVSTPARFPSIEAYAHHLGRSYPLASAAAVRAMAEHGLRRAEDGTYVLKLDPALRSARRILSSGPEGHSTKSSTDELRGLMHKIRCPTLVVRAHASSALTSNAAQQMVAEDLTDASITTVPRSGHAVIVDNPEGFAKALLPFLNGCRDELDAIRQRRKGTIDLGA